MSRDAILIMNAGSSSLKFAFYGAGDLSVQARGALDTAGGTVRLRSLEGQMADAFHVSLGFREVGDATIHGGKKSVRYFQRELAGRR